MTTLTNWKEI